MLSYSWPIAAPYHTGALTVGEDNRADVALAGHPYMVDWERAEDFRRVSIPLMREQQDTSQKPGEQSINPNGLWRRSVESWHYGAGQSWLDRAESHPFRFSTSKGVDPWERYGLSMLPDTSLAQAATGTNQYLTVAGGRLYAADGNAVRVTGVGDETFASATGLPGESVTGLASDGSACYAGLGVSGIYKATTAVFASHITGTVGLVGFVKGRLIAANGPALHNPVAAGALPAAFYTHPNSAWTWTDLAEGPGHIYASGFAGDRSAVYRTAVKPDGTALDIPVVAGSLPDGEIARSLTGYLGYVVIGTDLGLRFAVPDSNGYLNIGALIPTGSPVYCGEGQDRFVWYGLTNYDGVSTGLGRLDLRTFTESLTPAYASDLMATGQGVVRAVATYLDKRWFTVSGLGIHKQAATKVPSGTLVGGRVGFGLPDPKTALFLTVRHDALAANEEVVLELAVDNGTPTPVGLSDLDASSQPGVPFELTNIRGNDFEWTITLNGDVTLRSVTLRADPTAERSLYITVPILLRDTVESDGVEIPVDVVAEYEFLNELRDSRRVVTYQEGSASRRVIVEDTDWRPWRKTADRRFYQGTYLLKMKGV